MDQILKGAKRQIFYVPGEHDSAVDGGKLYLERYGKGTMGKAGTASITRACISSAW